MKELIGVLLLDQAEIVLRVYQVNETQWQLLHYFSRDLAEKRLESAISAEDITKIILEFLSHTHTQSIAEWKIGSRGISEEIINMVATATGFTIERIERSREQELLCKGLFTELW